MINLLRVVAPKGSRNRSTVQRQLDVAVSLWLDGRPAEARRSLERQGLGPLVPLFDRTVAAWHRRLMDAATRGDADAIRRVRLLADRRVRGRMLTAPRR
jgi:hypothetical protein